MVLEEGEKLAASSLGAHYVETSDKSNSNISTAFELLTQDLWGQTEWEGVKSRVPLQANLRRQRTKAGQGGCACAADPWVEKPRPPKPMEPL